ncbi:Nuclear pore complex protein NUP98A [Camellia lanceoleosa]|uniref:Nuclear pore complex protein NUP98A n=1 Tax=Camellia lanceoleosa TaxID=1840588 RepID=A0ACC0HFD3_9ERIC|nr:Nuclear pore complex protein NUP98A [Camellia lanceoleosa]
MDLISSLLQSSLSTPFQSVQPAQTTAGTSGFGGMPSIFGQSTFGQSSVTQGSAVAQPLPVANPFGTLPAMPQMSIGRSGIAPSIQYGISSLPISMTCPVPFFTDDEETPSTPKADPLFIPRENPRALVIRPLEQWPPRTNVDKSSPLKDTSSPTHENARPGSLESLQQLVEVARNPVANPATPFAVFVREDNTRQATEQKVVRNIASMEDYNIVESMEPDPAGFRE